MGSQQGERGKEGKAHKRVGEARDHVEGIDDISNSNRKCSH